MKPYFETMERLGKALKEGRIKRAQASSEQLRQTEDQLEELKKGVEAAGFSTEKMNQRGVMTVWQRISYN